MKRLHISKLIFFLIFLFNFQLPHLQRQAVPQRTSVIRKASFLKKIQCGVVDEQNAKPSDILEPCYLGTDHEKSYWGWGVFEPQEFFSLTYSLYEFF